MCSDLQRAVVQAFNASSNVYEMAVNLDMLHPKMHLDLISICRAYKAPDMLKQCKPQMFKVSGVFDMQEAFNIKMQHTFALPYIVRPFRCVDSWDNMEVISVDASGIEMSETFQANFTHNCALVWEFDHVLLRLAHRMNIG